VNGFLLDAGARMSYDVALGTAAAMGDERCGTEHLLFGVIATSRGDMSELGRVFALDPLRLERAILSLRAGSCTGPERHRGDPPLSERARAALEGPSLSRHQRRSSFDLLVGMLADRGSGAAAVLVQLGVRLSEIKRLAELGAARLGRDEVKDLIAALDRRAVAHQPWWGPEVDARVTRIPLPNGRPVEITRSRSTVATLDGLVAGPDGFGLTLSFSSRRSWVLPPVWEAREELVPGLGAAHRLEPDVVLVQIHFPDGSSVSNRHPAPRWSSQRPPASLVRLGQRSSVHTRNDRRIPERRDDTSEWWVWPLPAEGDLVLDLVWPAEAVTGSLRIDGTELARNAAQLRAVS
jgi:hypothetical protein